MDYSHLTKLNNEKQELEHFRSSGLSKDEPFYISIREVNTKIELGLSSKRYGDPDSLLEINDKEDINVKWNDDYISYFDTSRNGWGGTKFHIVRGYKKDWYGHGVVNHPMDWALEHLAFRCKGSTDSTYSN